MGKQNRDRLVVRSSTLKMTKKRTSSLPAVLYIHLYSDTKPSGVRPLSAESKDLMIQLQTLSLISWDSVAIRNALASPRFSKQSKSSSRLSNTLRIAKSAAGVKSPSTVNNDGRLFLDPLRVVRLTEDRCQIRTHYTLTSLMT